MIVFCSLNVFITADLKDLFGESQACASRGTAAGDGFFRVYGPIVSCFFVGLIIFIENWPFKRK